MNRSTFWIIKYMNGSVFSKARYMNGVRFEILARTPVPKLPLIKYMNGSVFSKARYMNGVRFEILARTPVPKLPLSYPPPPPPTPEGANPQWVELTMSRTNFHGPKDVRLIEIRLYFIHQIVKQSFLC